MIYFFIFILMLSIYELYTIAKSNDSNKTVLIVVYIFLTIFVLAIGIYYYLYQFGNSLTYYIFKLFNIHY